MRLHLHRFADTPFGVFGYLDLFDDAGERVARFCTAEDDWLDNLVGESAIPAGTYRCEAYPSPSFGPTWQVMEVPGRAYILFHWGNTEENVRGCILLGERFGCLTVKDEDAPGQPMTTKWAVLESKVAFTRFRQALAGLQEFELTIAWAAPGSWRD